MNSSLLHALNDLIIEFVHMFGIIFLHRDDYNCLFPSLAFDQEPNFLLMYRFLAAFRNFINYKCRSNIFVT